MPRVSAVSLRDRKKAGEKIAVLTAYDFPTAKLIDQSGVDVVLVGDSCGMVVMGRENTLSVTMDEMVYHTRIVSSAVERALVVGDMPFLSYQVSPQEAVRNAGRLIVEGGAQAVKLEGPAQRFGDTIRAILDASIPVMGHIGLQPQSIHQLGGYKVQGRDAEGRTRLIEEAKGLEQIGCFAIVLECVPASLAKEITESISIPTIGIGAGPDCDGQVLVMHDMLGMGKYTKFSKVYFDAGAAMKTAFESYVSEVKSGAFPTAEHSFE
ncbi:MAG: 3-methyl-2-oxobutanoate hydroxymethyltransferase [Candidatus Hydrogenedentes bacterium]|nr:3-methyl-2-oxobutanoate hydroxymethyltransferase [Candidatus Hydrogenedentota bacterium]